MSNPQLSYTGLDILETLQSATNYNALLLNLILRSAGERRPMLDFGAGVGTFAKLLRNRDAEVVCVEADAYLSDMLARDGFLTFRDLNDVPDGSFDFIFTLNVLEHISDDLTTVYRLGTKLKKQGRLLVYVPAFQCLWTSLDDKVKHCRRYRRAELERLICSAELSPLESGYVDSLGFFAALVFRIFGNQRGDLSARACAFYDRCVIPLSKGLDHLLSGLFGKNVYVVAAKIEGPAWTSPQTTRG
jgi:SAM-dependent methyltransferase